MALLHAVQGKGQRATAYLMGQRGPSLVLLCLLFLPHFLFPHLYSSTSVAHHPQEQFLHCQCTIEPTKAFVTTLASLDLSHCSLASPLLLLEMTHMDNDIHGLTMLLKDLSILILILGMYILILLGIKIKSHFKQKRKAHRPISHF